MKQCKSRNGTILLIGALCVLAVVGINCRSSVSHGPTHEAGDIDLLVTAVCGPENIHLYAAYGEDSAVLGFYLIDPKTDKRSYFPMMFVTCRGLPDLNLDVYVSDDDREMWIWKSGEVVGYHRVGSGVCMTECGELSAFDNPIPETVGGGSGNYPKMDSANAKKILTVTYPNTTTFALRTKSSW